MQKQRHGKRIEILFHRSVRRSVRIRVCGKAPGSDQAIMDSFPSEISPIRRQLARPRKNLPRIIRIEPLAQPAWRIIGDHDPELACSRKGAL